MCRGVSTCCQVTVFISWSEQYHETKMIKIYFSSFLMNYKNRHAVLCKYQRSPAVLQVFCNFSWLSLNLDGNYVCESVIIIHKSLSPCEYCSKNFSAITVSSIGHFIWWWKIWKSCTAHFDTSCCIVYVWRHFECQFVLILL